jgi:hypothetical protein
MESSDQSFTDYFLYVKNVLGVKTLQSSSLQESLREVRQNPQPGAVSGGLEQKVQTGDLLFLNIRTEKEVSVFSPEVKDLADKMIQAMRLGSRKVLLIETVANGDFEPTKFLQENAAKLQFQMVVFFSEKPGEQGLMKNLGAQKYIETFSPGYLLKNPQAKKVAWMDLQKTMKELRIS